MKKIISSKFIYFSAIIVVLTVAISIYTQQKMDKTEKPEMSCPMMDKMADKNKSHEDCPMMKKTESQTSTMKMDKNSKHHDMVMENGEKAMGFSQTATTHHFLIMKDGGAIQVEANDPADIKNRDAIRSHLTEIAKQFTEGIFTTPFAVHGQMPTGVKVMDELKKDIEYRYEETKNGAQVRILTKNPNALAAIYDFLKFQIEEHQTGDPLSIQN